MPTARAPPGPTSSTRRGRDRGGRRAGQPAEAIGRSGIVSVIRDVGLRENFSGSTAISSGGIDEDVERYLNESEQIESALACDTTVGADGRIRDRPGCWCKPCPAAKAR